MIDVLKDLHENKISLDEAWEIYDRIMEENPGEIGTLLNLSLTEMTAFVHGAGFEDLARWRYSGWPVNCAICGKGMVIENFGWIVKEGKNDTSTIVHVECLSARVN